ncbi:MAG: GH3 auxin-responsive promoter family protein, partial [Hafnia sp.]
MVKDACIDANLGSAVTHEESVPSQGEKPDFATIAKMMHATQLAEGEEAYDRLNEGIQHAREVQESLLFDLLEKNKDTPFGRKYGFADIHTVEEFKRQVPPTTYDDYAEWIYEVMEHGAQGAITADPTVHFSETSGTMGNPKGIPNTEAAIKLFLQYTSSYSVALLNREFGSALVGGRKFSLVEVRLKTLKGGATFGAISSRVMFSFKEMLPLMTTSPVEAIFSTPDTDTRYLHARFVLAEQDIRELTAAFVSQLLDLMRYIEDNAKMLLHDIETGTIDASVQLPDEVRAAIESRIKPDPQRAAQLREAFSEGFEKPVVKRIWPNMMVITTVAGAGFAPYTERLRRYTGDIPVYYVGYTASEGCFSVPFELNNPQSVLVPELNYFEFLPLGQADYAHTLGVEDLEVGKSYEVLVTNRSGLYRYLMRDAIRVTGRRGTMPTIEFLFRIDQTVNMKGEKTSEMVLRGAADRVAERCGFELVDFSVYPDLDAQPPRYEFLYELYHPDFESLDSAEIARVTDEELRAGNIDMEDMSEDGTFAPASVRILHEQTYQLWRDMRVVHGASPNQIKPVHIIDTDQKKKFFYAL